MTSALQATDLGKRYGRKWALSGCTLDIPTGHVVGLVGPNGAGKTTLLHLAVGLLTPSSRLHQRPGRGAGDERRATRSNRIRRAGHPGLREPLYRRAPEHGCGAESELGRRRWPSGESTNSDLIRSQRAGRLSGGQRAQLALTLAIAKRPSLLLLGRTGRGSGPLGSTRVPGHTDGSRGGQRSQRHPELASRGRSRARL